MKAILLNVLVILAVLPSLITWVLILPGVLATVVALLHGLFAWVFTTTIHKQLYPN